MFLRRCGAGDIETLRALSLDTFSAAFGHLNTPENMKAYCEQAFGEAALRRQMETPGSSFWFLFAEEALAGYMKLNTDRAQTDNVQENALEIERIYVSAAYQGRGLGGFLLEQAASEARRLGKDCVWLGVWEHNTRAIQFYESHGFYRCGEHGFCLGGDRQTDILMCRELH